MAQGKGEASLSDTVELNQTAHHQLLRDGPHYYRTMSISLLRGLLHPHLLVFDARPAIFLNVGHGKKNWSLS